MPSLLTTLTPTASLLLFLLLLGLFSAQGLPTSSRSGTGSHLQAGQDLAHLLLTASSPAKTLTKRDLSVSQELQYLADMLRAQEARRRQAYNDRSQAFLLEVGKRAGVFGSVGEDSEEEGGLVPTLLEPSEKWVK